MLLEETELKPWVAALRSGNFEFAQSEDDTWGLHLFFSLYFFEHPTMEKREKVYALCERFVALTEDALKLIYFGRGGVHKLGSKYGQIRGKKENNDKDKPFFLTLSSADSENDSAGYNFDSVVNRDDHQRVVDLANPSYSHLRIGIPAAWFEGEHRTALLALVAEAADQLNAQQGYGGYGWALPMSHHAYLDFEATEHHFAHEFYGFDIDKPFYMCSGHAEDWSLEKGLRAPSWLTFVGDEWLVRLGGAAVVTEQLLAHPEVQVRPYIGGLVVQAGDSPNLYPVDDGLPGVMVHIAEILKPVRAPTLNLLSWARFDGDEEIDHIFFDLNKCARWLGRYDRDSDWPTPERRKPRPASTTAAPKRLRGLPGELVPASGLWWTPALPGAAGKRRFAQGERFPDTQHTDYGAVIWYLNEH
jgi:hypothetical protein